MLLLFLGCVLAAGNGVVLSEPNTAFRLGPGTFLVLLYSVLSAVATISTEHLLKNVCQHFMFQNLQMYLWGALFAACMACGTREKIRNVEVGAFTSCAPFHIDQLYFTAALILALAGVSTSAVMKFANSVVKTYAASSSLVVTLFLSSTLFHGSVHAPVWIGCFLVVSSICLKSGVIWFLIPSFEGVVKIWHYAKKSASIETVAIVVIACIGLMTFIGVSAIGALHGAYDQIPSTRHVSSSTVSSLQRVVRKPSSEYGVLFTYKTEDERVQVQNSSSVKARVKSTLQSTMKLKQPGVFAHPLGSQQTLGSMGFVTVCIKKPTQRYKLYATPICLKSKSSSRNQKNISPFYNVHEGQSAVLFGNGPTLEHYRHIEFDSAGQHIVTAGVNSIIRSTLPVDYLFLFDKGEKVMRGQQGTGWASDPAAFNAYTPRIAKFYGYYPKRKTFGPPLQGSGARQVDAAWLPTFKPQPLVKDVGNFEFGGAASTTFSALQFLLFTGVQHIFLVGQDAGGGYAREGVGKSRQTIRTGKELKCQLRMWAVAKEFVHSEYPLVKVTVLNPVGLKGLLFNEVTAANQSNRTITLFGLV
eukprot:CAMPEP_0181352634 /NCGR_PEP_ID=MMETSP1106-20121128/2414_1 /TAXON_ID=81844 /ORGANISM="Mantoniella antarctica, Strain SL-175" /LENGTH=584 /DNA_ID=CAMNT_0023465207 /DNA_START=478 /DNA_END=2232 /DNA_ORIENTATION=+